MSKRYHAFIQLLLFRLRGFYREPEAVFWVYIFPIMLTVLLGIAFRNQPPQQPSIDIEASPAADALIAAFAEPPLAEQFEVEVCKPGSCAERLRLGKSAVTLAVDPDSGAYVYRFDETRPESRYARLVLDDALQRRAGRADPVATEDAVVTEPGSRYIDFLIPGLLGMNLMGGGMWGVGYTIVDLRVRKLLKRFLATPMRQSYFLLAMVGGRMSFVLLEIGAILAAGVLMFQLPVAGHPVAIVTVAMCGAVCFSGMGLLVASRAQRLETVAGLMNVVMMPMWLMSGLFFSTDHFPALLQPVIQALPLTQLLNVLRSVILEGSTLASQAGPLLYLLAIAGASFGLALKWFRWT